MKEKMMKSRVGKIPGIIFSESKYPGYLLEVDIFAEGDIGYYPHARVFTSVNTRGIYFQNVLSNPNEKEQTWEGNGKKPFGNKQ